MTGTQYQNKFKVNTTGKFNVAGRPQNQYRLFVSASPNKSSDAATNVIHGVIFYTENGSTSASRFRWHQIYSNNSSHWSVGFYDRNHFYIWFEGPDDFDYLNVNIR